LEVLIFAGNLILCQYFSEPEHVLQALKSHKPICHTANCPCNKFCYSIM